MIKTAQTVQNHCAFLDTVNGNTHSAWYQVQKLQLFICWITLHWDIHAAVKTCLQQVYTRQKMPMATFSQPHVVTIHVHELLATCMTRTINFFIIS